MGAPPSATGSPPTPTAVTHAQGTPLQPSDYFAIGATALGSIDLGAYATTAIGEKIALGIGIAVGVLTSLSIQLHNRGH